MFSVTFYMKCAMELFKIMVSKARAEVQTDGYILVDINNFI